MNNLIIKSSDDPHLSVDYYRLIRHLSKKAALSEITRDTSRYHCGVYKKIYFGFVDKVLVATISVVEENKPAYEEYYATIEDVVVLPEYRNMGIAKEMINHYLHTRPKDVGKVRLMCNPELEEFYKSLGFEKVGIAMAISYDTK